MTRLSHSKPHSTIEYEFTASSGFDYNYDPVDGRTTVRSPSKTQFDPYSDDFPPSDDFASVTEPEYHSKPTPTPPTSPSASYILESCKPSTRLSSPSSSRKLLILDLNGTLVFRSPHRPRPARRPYRPYNYHNHNGRSDPPVDPYATFDPNFGRPLRTVHPRPYMSSFTSYLFHPTTRTWLDTMVWSSAQPHSVADMVGRCFGERKDELVAVWARDTLGLEEKDYNRKTQTTKDLAKPWAALPLQPSGPDFSEGPPPSPSSSLFPKPNESRAQAHSAHTTLLLDDSPLKAHLQPWNHLCISEYDAGRRSADLVLREHERELARRRILDDGGAVSGNGEEEEHVERASSEETLASDGRDTDNADGKKKRKRPKKDKSKSKSDGELTVPKVRTYDQALLAVIGILDALKHESNVAGWIRGGRVHRSRERPTPTPTPAAAGEGKELGAGVGGQGADTKRRRGSDEGTGTARTRGHADQNEGHPPPSDPSSPSSADTDTSFPGLGVFDAHSFRVVRAPEHEGGTPAVGQGQWYEDGETVAYWVERGLGALDELGIGVAVGVGEG